MAAAAKTDGDGDEDSKRDESLFILQENHKFDEAIVALLFSVDDYDTVDDDIKNLFNKFFNDM